MLKNRSFNCPWSGTWWDRHRFPISKCVPPYIKRSDQKRHWLNPGVRKQVLIVLKNQGNLMTIFIHGKAFRVSSEWTVCFSPMVLWMCQILEHLKPKTLIEYLNWDVRPKDKNEVPLTPEKITNPTLWPKWAIIGELNSGIALSTSTWKESQSWFPISNDVPKLLK